VARFTEFYRHLWSFLDITGGPAAPPHRRPAPRLEQLERRDMPSCLWHIPVVNTYLQRAEVLNYPSPKAAIREYREMLSGASHTNYVPNGKPYSDCGQSGTKAPGNGISAVTHTLNGLREIMLGIEFSVRNRQGMFDVWTPQSADWRVTVKHADSVQSMSRLLLRLEDNISFDSQVASWEMSRPSWLQQVRRATTAHQLVELAQELRNSLLSQYR
jgi:hypothetical protein